MSYNKLKDEFIDELLQQFFGAEFFNPKHAEVSEYFKDFRKSFKDSNTKIITVAGTNGKGQTAHYINDYLTSLGKSCALWTSPHVLSVTERYKFGSEYIDHDELTHALKYNYSKEQKMSYYEFLLHTFCSLCCEKNLDYIILEVGLGGRLDAVNFLDADFSLLTSISKDHEEFLGSSLSGILKEKLGVSRATAPHFSSLEQAYLRSKQKEYLSPETEIYDLFSLGIIKETDNYQLRNKLLAMYFLSTLLGDEVARDKLLEKIESFVCSVTKGRQEEVTIKNIKFIFIGAHNVDGIRKMRDYFLSQGNLDRSHILCAFSKRKNEDIIASLEIFKSAPCVFESINVTSFEHLKALPLESVPRLQGVSVIDDWKVHLDEILNYKKGQWIVAGSYYFIGEVQKYLNSRFSIL